MWFIPKAEDLFLTTCSNTNPIVHILRESELLWGGQRMGCRLFVHILYLVNKDLIYTEINCAENETELWVIQRLLYWRPDKKWLKSIKLWGKQWGEFSLKSFFIMSALFWMLRFYLLFQGTGLCHLVHFLSFTVNMYCFESRKFWLGFSKGKPQRS